jgi:hypothetical protein
MLVDDNNSDMLGFTFSQSVAVWVMVASLIMYFAGITFAQQNAWSYIFSVALLCFIVGTYAPSQTCSS